VQNTEGMQRRRHRGGRWHARRGWRDRLAASNTALDRDRQRDRPLGREVEAIPVRLREADQGVEPLGLGEGRLEGLDGGRVIPGLRA
jgi:hypothetical protein